jgi:hypothetical protein
MEIFRFVNFVSHFFIDSFILRFCVFNIYLTLALDEIKIDVRSYIIEIYCASKKIFDQSISRGINYDFLYLLDVTQLIRPHLMYLCRHYRLANVQPPLYHQPHMLQEICTPMKIEFFFCSAFLVQPIPDLCPSPPTASIVQLVCKAPMNCVFPTTCFSAYLTKKIEIFNSNNIPSKYHSRKTETIEKKSLFYIFSTLKFS